MSTIVVGYDETPGSQLALERAATLAKALGAKLVVTSVTPLMVSIGRSGGPIDPTDPPEKHAKELESARASVGPARVTAPYLLPEEVLAIAEAGRDAGCHEALFTLGERPELRYPVAAEWLADHGYTDMQEVSHTEERLTFALPQELRRDLRTARR